MTNTIKASEVRPGMEVQFDLSGWDVKGTVATVDVRPHAVWIYTEKWCEMSLDLDSPVTVLSEPAPPQPEEPTEFGARVVAGRERFLLCDCDSRPWRSVSEDGALGFFADWPLVCEAGPVKVIDADPSWTVPEDTPEDTPVVPDRIEEWPEDDEHLRAYQWRDRDGDLWWSVSNSRNPWVVGFADRTGAFHPYPKCGPWVRVP
nr:hypothetical protein [Kocuria rhizophila]